MAMTLFAAAAATTPCSAAPATTSSTATSATTLIDGGAGWDRATFTTGAIAGVTVDLNIVGAQNTGQGLDTLVNIEHVSGTGFTTR